MVRHEKGSSKALEIHPVQLSRNFKDGLEEGCHKVDFSRHSGVEMGL